MSKLTGIVNNIIAKTNTNRADILTNSEAITTKTNTSLPLSTQLKGTFSVVGTDLQLDDGLFSISKGFIDDGTDNVVITKSGTITPSNGWTNGIDYIKIKEDGTQVATVNKPSYGMYEKQSADDNRDVYIGGKWYPTSGGDLVVNGTFDTDVSGWTGDTTSYTTTTFSQESGKIKIVRGSYAWGSGEPYQMLTTEVGKKYVLELNANGDMTVGISFTNAIVSESFDTFVSDYRKEFIAESTTTYIKLLNSNSNSTAYVDNVFVYAVEPTLGTAYTEQFTYLSQDGKLLGVEVADGNVVDIHLDDNESSEVAPFISVPAIQTDTMVANEYKGKNACTAWVNFDGTTTPPTIRDSFNVSDVVRVGTGLFDVYFESNMDNINYSTAGTTQTGTVMGVDVKTTSKFEIWCRRSDNDATFNGNRLNVQILGGKN